jgi:hypothetical protein
MEINDALRSRQLERSEIMTQHALVEATLEGRGHMSYAMGECIFSPRRIYGCSSDGYVVLRVWGMDQQGQQINAVITFSTERAARCAAAAALADLGARAHFYIASLKDKALPRLLTKTKTSPTKPTRLR